MSERPTTRQAERDAYDAEADFAGSLTADTGPLDVTPDLAGEAPRG
jgi:hypothetical protein